MDETKIREMTAAWQNETDEYVLKAATENINEYPPEIRIIIRDESLKRGLLKYDLSKAGVKGLEFEAVVTDKGGDILTESEEKSPKIFSLRVIKTYVALCVCAAIAGLIGLIFGLPESIITVVGGTIAYAVIQRIWARHRAKPKDEQKQ